MKKLYVLPCIIALLMMLCSAMALAKTAAKVPVFDIPRLDSIAIDGSPEDWANRGLPVELFDTRAHDGTQIRGNYSNSDGRLQLGWEERGLLVLLTVHDDIFTEATDQEALYTMDAAEFFVADKVGGEDSYQIIAGPGIGEGTPEPRFQPYDRRKSVELKKSPLAFQIKRTKIEGGYVMEALFPWSNLGIVPRLGTELAFNMQIDDVDSPEVSGFLTWYPQLGSYADSHLLRCLRLAKKAGPGSNYTVNGSYKYMRQAVINIIGASNLAGKRIAVLKGKRVLGRTTLAAGEHRARGTVSLPFSSKTKEFGTLTVTVDGESPLTLDMPSMREARNKVLNDARFVFDSFVFSGSMFPEGDFELPGLVEDIMGSYTADISYYDSSFNKVTLAEKPGRYGALVRIKGESGESLLRTYTLYRLPDGVFLNDKEIIDTLSFAPGVSIDAQVQKEQANELSKISTAAVVNFLENDPRGAMMLAWLAETPAGSPPHVQPRLETMNPIWVSADEAWWIGLKNKTGDLVKYRHFEYFPEGYDAKSDKRWPLIIKLHGYGGGEPYYAGKETEIGNSPLVQRALKEYPCILSAPLSYTNSFWTPALINVLLDDLMATYKIDPDRVYLIGSSAGGHGSFSTAIDYPDRFAAIVPICGWGDATDIANLKNIPVWAFHGDKDTVIDVKNSYQMIDALKAIGGDAKLTVFPGEGHDINALVYKEPDLFKWLSHQVRKK